MNYICITDDELGALTENAAVNLITALNLGPGEYIFIAPSGATASHTITTEAIHANA